MVRKAKTSVEKTPKKSLLPTIEAIKTQPLDDKKIDNKIENVVKEINKNDHITSSVKKKIQSLLDSNDVVREKVCQRLLEGLDASKPIVADGEIISYEPDHVARPKYIELIADILGEKKPASEEGFMISIEEFENRTKRLMVLARKVG